MDLSKGKFSPKRLITGLLLIFASVLLGIMMDGVYTGPQSQMWQRLVFIIVVIGTGAGGLAAIFFGLKGALIAIIGVALLGASAILPDILPEPWNRYYAIIYFVGLFGWIAYSNSRKKQKAQAPVSAPDPDEEYQEEENVQQLLPGSLLGYDPISGYSYQILRTGSQLRLYRVGGAIKGVEPRLLLREGQPIREVSKKDIAVAVDDIRSVRYNTQQHGGIFVLKLRGKTVRLLPVEKEDAFFAFFKQWMQEEALSDLQAEQKELPAWVQPAHIAVHVLAAAVNLAWLFLYVPYTLFAVLSLLTWLLPFVLYGIFPDYFTILEATRKSTKKSFAIVMLLSGCAVTVRTLKDYPNFLSFGELAIAAGIFVVILTAAVIIFTKQWKKQKSIIFMVIVLGIFSGFGIVGQLNCTFDPNPPQSRSAIVTGLRTSEDDGKVQYYLEATLHDGTQWELEVTESRYSAIHPGDAVNIDVYSGLLGITYGFVQ